MTRQLTINGATIRYTLTRMRDHWRVYAPGIPPFDVDDPAKADARVRAHALHDAATGQPTNHGRGAAGHGETIR